MARTRKPYVEAQPSAPEPYAESQKISEVPIGDRRAMLAAIVARLAAETDDLKWEQHKNECVCFCDMINMRALVAVVKELRTSIAELETLPSGKEASTSDDLAKRRADRLAESAG